MTPEEKKLIDGMDYVGMLRAWRHSPSGHYLFSGDTGEYFKKIMLQKKNKLEPAERVAASKEVGW